MSKYQYILSASLIAFASFQGEVRPRFEKEEVRKKSFEKIKDAITPKEKPEGVEADTQGDIKPPKEQIDKQEDENIDPTEIVPKPDKGAILDDKEPIIEEVQSPADDFGPLQMRDANIAEHVPNQILYFSKNMQSEIERYALDADVAILEVSQLDQIGVSMVTAQLKPGDSVAKATERLQALNGIIWAQPNHYFQLLGSNSRDKGYALHGVRNIQPISGVIVMIDSAVDKENIALKDANIEQKIYGIKGTAEAHGTAIAEIMVGTGDYAGGARGAKLISLAAFEESSKKGWLSQTRYLALALNEAAKIRPNVINLSFGASSDDLILSKLLNHIETRGICVASAAGNGNGGKTLFPARHENTLAVTAIDARKRAYEFASVGPEIDTAAWGVNMNAAVPNGRRSVSGTSFATAVVSASLMHMPACNGGRAPSEMRDMIAQYSQDLGERGRDDIFGAGLFQLPEPNKPKNNKPKGTSEKTVVSHESHSLLAYIAAALAFGLPAFAFFIFWRRRNKKNIQTK